MQSTEKRSILFAIFEAEPFLKTGGLGDIGGSFPGALKKTGCPIRVILPKFSSIPEIYREKMRKVAELTVPLAWRRQYCGIETLDYKGVTYYFVDNEYYFKRENPYGYGDDAERIAFFSKAVLESLQYLPDFSCAILHCNDWHTALIPVFLQEYYRNLPLYASIRTIFTIHNLAYQGIFPWSVLTDVLGFSENSFAARQLQYDDTVNYMKGGILYSDLLTTVSPTYAQEIRDSYFGQKMENFFVQRQDQLFGILNGIDTETYNPAHDPWIAYPYDVEHLEDKQRNKQALQQELGLPEKEDSPLFVMVSRLTEQKGVQLLIEILGQWLEGDVQVAVLGNGEKTYEEQLQRLSDYYPQKLRVHLTFDVALARRFYAGADGLIMPSRFEPCGLSQMIAMRYGTLPIVHETGGLKDTVQSYPSLGGDGWGFGFFEYHASALLGALQWAEKIYRQYPQEWRKLIKRAMRKDFGWERSAEQYRALYQKLYEQAR